MVTFALLILAWAIPILAVIRPNKENRFNPVLNTLFGYEYHPPIPIRFTQFREFIGSEVRYSSLIRSFPERADDLFAKATATAKDKYEHLLRLSKLYEA